MTYKINNSDGSILVLAVFILLLLTMIGIYATNTSTFELMISGNDKVSKINLYKAESAAYVGAKRIEALSTKPNANDPNTNWFRLDDNYDWNNPSTVEVVQALDPNGNVRYVVVDGGKYIPKGTAFNLKGSYGSAQINKFDITGRSAELGGESIVTIGYKKEYY